MKVANFKMADSDLEINVDDVCGSEHGVEVQTILHGQASLPSPAHELDFMVQEEVETTTEGDSLAVELDPVDNVIISLQESDRHLGGGGHFVGIQNGDLELDEPFRDCLQESPSSSALLLGKRRRGHGVRSMKGRGSSPGGAGAHNGIRKVRTKKSKKGSVRFVNRQIPAALSGAGVAKDAREANEVSFDPDKSPRKWRRKKVPVRTLDGGTFAVSMWCAGT